MLLTLTALLIVSIALGAILVKVFSWNRQLNVVPVGPTAMPTVGRYRPMLRLLSKEDAGVLAADKAARQKFQARRTQIFREYLRCLTKDYGRLLAGLRMTMLRSGTERPDLARILAFSKLRFLKELCRIEFHIYMHEIGFGSVDVSGLVATMDSLHAQTTFSTPSFSQAR